MFHVGVARGTTTCEVHVVCLMQDTSHICSNASSVVECIELVGETYRIAIFWVLFAQHPIQSSTSALI